MKFFVILYCVFIANASCEDEGINRLLGNKLKGNRYNDTAYNNKGTAKSGNDLNCDFDSTNCCWKNKKPPDDQLDFVLFEGSADKPKLQKNFNTTDGPSGKYLVVATTSKPTSDDQAHMTSCPLICTDDAIKVSLRYWATKIAKLQICLQEANDGPLLNCQLVPKNPTGPSEITFPPMQNVHIVIIASNFSAKSIAIIDDILVAANPCKSTTTSTSTTTVTSTTTTTAPLTTAIQTTDVPLPRPFTANEPPVNNAGQNQPDKSATQLCQAVVCNFEDGSSCAYQQRPLTASKDVVHKAWELTTGPYKNPATGIRKPGEGSNYMAVYLKPKEVATIETAVDFPEDRVVKFLVYKVVDKIELKACCDETTTCPYSTETKVQLKNYNQWQQGGVQCPKGTKKIIFQGINSGNNEGAIGMDDIQLQLTDNQNAC